MMQSPSLLRKFISRIFQKMKLNFTKILVSVYKYCSYNKLESLAPPGGGAQWGIELILGPFVVHLAILGIDS